MKRTSSGCTRWNTKLQRSNNSWVTVKRTTANRRGWLTLLDWQGRRHAACRNKPSPCLASLGRLPVSVDEASDFTSSCSFGMVEVFLKVQGASLLTISRLLLSSKWGGVTLAIPLGGATFARCFVGFPRAGHFQKGRHSSRQTSGATVRSVSARTEQNNTSNTRSESLSTARCCVYYQIQHRLDQAMEE